MTDVQAEQVEVDADPSAPRVARRFIARVLDAWRVHVEVIERSQLLVSELVSNAVQYGDGPIRVVVRQVENAQAGATGEHAGMNRAAAFRIEVCNSGQGRPAVRHPSALEVSGRGLQIVDELSRSWGSVTGDDATSVWFEMHADAPV